MTNYDVLKKLIGNIEPAGDSAIDHKRLENLEATCELVETLIEDIKLVAYHNQFAHQASIKIASEYAKKFLKNLELTD